MLALLGLACTPGLENLVRGDTHPSKPSPPANPHIPTLPQHDSLTYQQEHVTLAFYLLVWLTVQVDKLFVSYQNNS